MDEMYRELVSNIQFIEDSTDTLSEISIKLLARIERMQRILKSERFQMRGALQYSAKQIDDIRRRLEILKKELKYLVPLMKQIVKMEEYKKLEKKINEWTPELYLTSL